MLLKLHVDSVSKLLPKYTARIPGSRKRHAPHRHRLRRWGVVSVTRSCVGPDEDSETGSISQALGTGTV